MRALLCKSFGPPESLVIEDVPEPVPGRGQIRIDIHAAGLNPNDLLKLRGEHHEKPQPPFSPGSEVAGIVGAVGTGVTQFAIGDRVMATTPGAIGGMAEAIALPATAMTRQPSALAISMAGNPTPPPAPSTSTVSPGFARPENTTAS